MANQLRHAEGQHREVGAAQVQHGRAHQHRHRARDGRAAQDDQRPGQHLEQCGARVRAEPEEGRGGERQVARGTAEQRPARGQRDVHQAAERDRRDELARDPWHGGCQREADGEHPPGLVLKEGNHLLENSPLGRQISTPMNTAYDSSILSEGLV
ncbi:hypothetical protein D9M69_562480 [compost metagenome]